MKRIFILFIFLLFLSACGTDYPIETNMSENVTDFEFTNQDNEAIALSDLEGKWWIADFIFTNCTTVCLPMTANMAALQSSLKEENIDANLVSFSIDPERDTPEVLKAYGESYGADFDSWHFLTGYEFETIKEFSIKSFKSLVAEAPEGDDQITHGISFFLVSPEGEVVKNYSGVESDVVDQITADLKEVN